MNPTAHIKRQYYGSTVNTTLRVHKFTFHNILFSNVVEYRVDYRFTKYVYFYWFILQSGTVLMEIDEDINSVALDVFPIGMC